MLELVKCIDYIPFFSVIEGDYFFIRSKDEWENFKAIEKCTITKCLLAWFLFFSKGYLTQPVISLVYMDINLISSKETRYQQQHMWKQSSRPKPIVQVLGSACKKYRSFQTPSATLRTSSVSSTCYRCNSSMIVFKAYYIRFPIIITFCFKGN